MTLPLPDFVYREPALIVADVLQAELELADGQVMMANQPYEIPIAGIFIMVDYLGPSKVIASANEALDDGAGGLVEVQSVTMAHLIEIQMMGYDANVVRRRKEEIAMALRSVFSQQLQARYSMQIARQPGPFMDTSFLEETRMMTRFSTTVMTTSLNVKQKAVADIYTDFSRAVPPKVTANP